MAWVLGVGSASRAEGIHAPDQLAMRVEIELQARFAVCVRIAMAKVMGVTILRPIFLIGRTLHPRHEQGVAGAAGLRAFARRALDLEKHGERVNKTLLDSK